MKLKSLILGSAAAMFAVTGAQAAGDAIAEPMDYVKICDTYGSGYYFLPGTETCLRIQGEVRSEFIYTDVPGTPAATNSVTTAEVVEVGGVVPVVGAGNITAVSAGIPTVPAGAVGYLVTRNIVTPAVDGTTQDWRWRARVRITAASETDYGTLRSVIRLEHSGRGGNGGTTVVNRAFIELGGWLLGYQDSFFTTNTGYGWQLAANDGYFSFDRALALQYTFSGNGFSATIGVQDSNSIAAVSTSADPYDPYFGASYSASWGRIDGTVIYDSSANEAAWKVGVTVSAITNLSIKAWFAGDSGATQYVNGGLGADALATAIAAGTGPEWEWGADVTYAVNSMFSVWAGYTDSDVPDAERIGIGARWNPVTGLSVRPEAIFGNDYTQVRLRIVRSF